MHAAVRKFISVIPRFFTVQSRFCQVTSNCEFVYHAKLSSAVQPDCWTLHMTIVRPFAIPVNIHQPMQWNIAESLNADSTAVRMLNLAYPTLDYFVEMYRIQWECRFSRPLQYKLLCSSKGYRAVRYSTSVPAFLRYLLSPSSYLNSRCCRCPGMYNVEWLY